MIESYRSTGDIRHNRSMYHQRKSELEAAYREFDKASDEVFGKSNNEEDIGSSTTAAPTATTTKPVGSQAKPATRKSTGLEVNGTCIP